MATTVPTGSLRPTRTAAISLPGVDVMLDDRDRTQPFFVLHGGGGIATVRGFADLLAERTHSRVFTPTHPGFGGTSRPPQLASARDLATAYIALLDHLDVTDVTVVGNSFGGWVAAEMALSMSPRISGVIIVDGIGIEVDGHPMTDVSGLTPAQLTQLSYHDPTRAPKAMTDGTGPRPDIAALVAYAGRSMTDVTLAGRLGGIDVPVHVIWGESDGIVDPDYGRAFAEAIPMSTFTVLSRSGHLPQLETPEELLGAILDLGVACCREDEG